METEMMNEMKGRRRLRNGRLNAQRDRDFMAACRRLMASGHAGLTSARSVAAEAERMQAPLYYVSYDYALRAVRRYRSDGVMPRKSEAGRRKWMEIEGRMRELEERLGIDDTEALARVLGEKASSFFLSRATAVRLFHRVRKSRRKSN